MKYLTPTLTPTPGSLKALICISLFNVSFLRGYYVDVYISKSNTVFNLLYLFASSPSLHPITSLYG